jgi:hypothetical protein
VIHVAASVFTWGNRTSVQAGAFIVHIDFTPHARLPLPDTCLGVDISSVGRLAPERMSFGHLRITAVLLIIYPETWQSSWRGKSAPFADVAPSQRLLISHEQKEQ